MSLLAVAGVAAALLVAAGVFALSGRAVRPGEWVPAVSAAAGGGVLVIGLGAATRLESTSYLVGLAALALAVTFAIDAAALSTRVDRAGRAGLLLGWTLVVFPAAALVPVAVARACGSPDCRITDFGGSLPLFVSAAAYLALAWVVPAGGDGIGRFGVRRIGTRRFGAGLAAVVVGFAGWLVHLEGAIDAYTARILFGVAVAVAGGLTGWITVDALRGAPPRPRVAATGGVVAGLVAIAPGAVAIQFPWTAVVALVAGVAASLTWSARGLRDAGTVGRAALTALSAAAVGLLAPPIVGETVGILFSARIGAVPAPAAGLIGVAAIALLAGAPIWLSARSRALRGRPRAAESPPER